jgi:hypothetical protein
MADVTSINGPSACSSLPALCDQPHPIAVAFQAQPIAVVLDFVDPIGGVGNLGSPRGNAKIERLAHARKDRKRATKWLPVKRQPERQLTVGTVVLVDEIRERWRQLATDKTDPAHDLARDVF